MSEKKAQQIFEQIKNARSKLVDIVQRLESGVHTRNERNDFTTSEKKL